MAAPSGRALRVVAFVAVAVAALYVCLWRLGQQTTTGDENVYVTAGWAYVHGDVSPNREHPPTAKYLYGIAQLVAGQGTIGPRIVAALAVLGTGLVLFLWLRRSTGFWGGLTAAGLWWTTPRAIGAAWTDPGSSIGVRIDRFALLEPIMVFFAVAALACAWAWAEHRRWWWIAAAGGLLAASVTSKVSTAVLVVAIAALPVLFRRPRELLVGGGIGALAFGTVFVALYAPVGMVSGLTTMIRYQQRQNGAGHAVTINGVVHEVAPWWANIAFLVGGVGWPVLVVLGVGVVAAVTLRPGRLVAYLVIALGVLVAFSTVVVHVALPHYYDVWMPFVIALAAIGYHRVATGRSRPAEDLRPSGARPAVRIRSRVVAVALVAALVVPVGMVGTAVAQARPAGIARLDATLRGAGVTDGRVLFTSLSGGVWGTYFRARGSVQPARAPYVAIVVGEDRRYPTPTVVRRLLSTQRDAFRRVEVDTLTVWIPRHGTVVEDGGVLSVSG